MFLKEAFSLFKLENPQVSVGFSKFAAARPQNVLLVKNSPVDQCKCSTHENHMLKLKALKITYGNNSWTDYLCDSNNLVGACWMGHCAICKDGKLFEKARENSEKATPVTWKMWEKDGNTGRIVQNVKEGCVGELEDEVVSGWEVVLEHVRIKRIQSDLFQKMKVAKDQSILQIDFAMAYSCEYQNEVQSALWSRQSVNLFTAAFFSGGHYDSSYVFVTESKDKGKNSVIIFLRKFLSIEDHKKLCDKFSIFSDGPSAEFKNKFCVKMLDMLKKEFKLTNTKLQWNYSATSHGKGIVDGIGGRAKSLVRKAVMSKRNKVVVQSAHDFAEIAKSLMEKTVVVYVGENEIESVDSSLWETAKDALGIRSVHCVVLKGGKLLGFKNDLERENAVFEITTETDSEKGEGACAVGEWVVVEYDGKQYYGEVLTVMDDRCEVSVMEEQLGGVFKWPTRPDKIYYTYPQILRKINPPIPVGHRNQFKFL
ncbi:hypothetical protein RRG08_008009 [Elysia crispata]|uniref:Uncharacterized protein n=1 Tax=Elysia crispata TaxID=231223 RepID=A0AAE1D3T9_9GAST|nr:hypothetical protein RRG08_008009 [Elysia crispata]